MVLGEDRYVLTYFFFSIANIGSSAHVRDFRELCSVKIKNNSLTLKKL